MPVEVNPVTEVVITAVELLPVVTLHIHISIEHEVNHRILDENIMHVVELFRTGYHVRALLRSVASLIGVHHSTASIIQTRDKRFYIPVLEVSVGKDLLSFSQSILCILSGITASFGCGDVVLQRLNRNNKVGINIDTRLDAVERFVYLQQLIVTNRCVLTLFSSLFV